MMKILVPTDFSENANLALKHAIHVANQVGGVVHVLHTYQIQSRAGSFVSIEDIVHQDLEKEMNVLIQRLDPLLKSGTHLQGHVLKGNAVDSIIKKSKKLEVDMIIMGTTGAGGMKKLFLGSTASNVIQDSFIPVMAIPQDFQNFECSHVTLALDNKNSEEADVLSPLVNLVKSFNSTLMLVTVLDSTQLNAGVDPKIEAYLKKENVVYSFFGITSENVIDGIQQFVVREKSDLLCVLHRSRGLFEGMFDQSVAAEIAFDAVVPLLVLRA